MPNIDKWFTDGQKKTKSRKGYWKGFGAAIKRGKRYNARMFASRKK